MSRPNCAHCSGRGYDLLDKCPTCRFCYGTGKAIPCAKCGAFLPYAADRYKATDWQTGYDHNTYCARCAGDVSYERKKRNERAAPAAANLIEPPRVEIPGNDTWEPFEPDGELHPVVSKSGHFIQSYNLKGKNRAARRQVRKLVAAALHEADEVFGDD